MSVRKMLRNATVLGVSAALVFAGSTAANAAPKTVEVSVISSTSGGLKPFGDAYVAGLEWGLNYFTKGTMVVNNQKRPKPDTFGQVIDYHDLMLHLGGYEQEKNS